MKSAVLERNKIDANDLEIIEKEVISVKDNLEMITFCNCKIGDYPTFAKITFEFKDDYYIKKTSKKEITESKSILEEWLKNKKERKHGYKTANIFKVSNDIRYKVEYLVVAGDFDGYYWWLDRDNKITSFDNKEKIVDKYIKLKNKYKLVNKLA